MTLYLVVDTSTDEGLIALYKREKCLVERLLPVGHRNSKIIIPEMEKMFQEHQITPYELDFIACGVGPGSYTGIRVGAVVAKMIAYSCKKPLVGVHSLLLFTADGRYASVLDARIGGVYACFGQEPCLIPMEEVPQAFEEIETIVTPHLESLQPKMPIQVQWVKGVPSSKNMAAVALKKYLAGQFSTDGTLELLYLRKTQAEIEKSI